MLTKIISQFKAMEGGDSVAINPYDGELVYPPPFPVVRWKTVYQYSELLEIISWAMSRDEWVSIAVEDEGFTIYNPANMVYALYLGEVNLIRRGSPKRPPQLMIDGKVFTTISDYMENYDTHQDYLSRARMSMTLSLYNSEKEVNLGTEYGEFDPDKVENLVPRENHFHKPSVVLYYEGCKPLFGLSQITKAFPNLSNRQLARLYNQFEVPLPRKLK